MVDFTFRANNAVLENRYVTYSELGLTPPPGLGASALYSWGDNVVGQLGLGDITSRSSPVQVGALINWYQVSGGTNYSLAIKSDGTMWAWGRSIDGQLGLGDITHRSSPVQIGALTNWAQVSAGLGDHSLAIKTDGTLWAWGRNTFGQLGLGDITSRSSPVQVGALTNWYQVSSGAAYSLAVKTDGTLWGWGYNFSGEIGDGTTTARSSPVQVGSLTNWSQVTSGGSADDNTYSLAVKTDGTLWAWGINTSGQLGLGDRTHRSSPVQVGTLTNWYQVSSGTAHSLAVKTDGTLWAWGINTNGRLGLGDITSRSSPVQVGALTNWKQVSNGLSQVLAVKTDGTLWAWGFNGSGRLGLGDTTARSSPVQVGVLTNWYQVSAYSAHSMAITG